MVEGVAIGADALEVVDRDNVDWAAELEEVSTTVDAAVEAILITDGIGIEAIVVVGEESVRAGDESSVDAGTKIMEKVFPLASTSICWMTDIVATTSVTISPSVVASLSVASCLLCSLWC